MKVVRTSGFWWRLGSVSLWFREKWILAGTIGLGAIATVVIPRWPIFLTSDKQLTEGSLILLTIAGVLAAFAVVMDKIADRHSTTLETLKILSESAAGLRVLAAVNEVLDTVHDGAFLEGKARSAQWVTLRAQLAGAAAQVPLAADVRATYYPLDFDGPFRCLLTPKSRGRTDEANTEFRERNDPDNPIWDLLDGRDTESPIRNSPEECGVDWSKKKYRTFISVPIKAQEVTFGMVSINAIQSNDFDELDRVALISLARIMASVLAFDVGPRKLYELAQFQQSLAEERATLSSPRDADSTVGSETSPHYDVDKPNQGNDR